MYGTGKKLSRQRKLKIKKTFYITKKQKKIKNRIIRDIWILFETEVQKNKNIMKN